MGKLNNIRAIVKDLVDKGYLEEYNLVMKVNYKIGSGGKLKIWNEGVQFDENTYIQYENLAKLPFVGPWVAAMPDSHWGNGGPVGAVVPTVDALCPSVTGVDLGCGIMACKTDLKNLPEAFRPEVRHLIEKVVPAGRTNDGKSGDRGAWHDVPKDIHEIYQNEFYDDIFKLYCKHPKAVNKSAENQLGTLGTGNHFIEVSEDKNGEIYVVLHSGSRGFGNRIGSYFTEIAKDGCARYFVQLPDKELSYIPRGTKEFGDYISALHLAQRYAFRNREIMMGRILEVLGTTAIETINCHHNFVAEEVHFGKKVFITRKGAVRAQLGDAVIIPGAMGRATFLGRGLGNPDSFCSCSHGAGRSMGRKEAERRFTVDDHIRETAGLECDKTVGVLDETPLAYKDIQAVMAAQSDLVEPVNVLKALVCVKGVK